MTREEQIENFANSQVDCEFFDERLYKGIIIGAKWADEHPNLSEEEQVRMGELGMEWQKQALIKKVCKYLKDNIDKDLIIYCNYTWKSRDEFIDNLIKAMEE